MMDMSVFENLEEGQEKRGWLMTDIQVFCLQINICDKFADANLCAGALSPTPIFNGWT